jgi:uncharacterized protein
MNSLGSLYDAGKGVKQDRVEAVRWYVKAADQGNAAAEFNLAAKYESGEGVPQDYVEATRWYQKAADQGNVNAQFSLGMIYAQGQVVKRDYVEAYMWLNLAAAHATGDDQARIVKERELVAKKMSSKRIAEGQRRSREWKPDSK